MRACDKRRRVFLSNHTILIHYPLYVTAQFLLIEASVEMKGRSAIQLTSLQHEFEEKTKDLGVISAFINEKTGTEDKLNNIREQLVQQKEKHKFALENFAKKLENDMENIKKDWERKLDETRVSLRLMTEDALNKNTRRIMMETEKMEVRREEQPGVGEKHVANIPF